MKLVKQGFPEYIAVTGSSTEYVVVPTSRMGDVLDIGVATAHEIGHAVMGHRIPPVGPKEHILRELEAWCWAVSKRGLTKADKEYFWDEIVTDAEDCGIDRSELVGLLEKAMKNVDKKVVRYEVST